MARHLQASELGHHLPAFLRTLPSETRAELRGRMRYLSTTQYSAATRFWYHSGYAWLVDVVVLLYVNRPEIPYFPLCLTPIPTAEFAIKYLEEFDLSDAQNRALRFAIQTGDHEGEGLFSEQDGSGYSLEDPGESLRDLCAYLTKSQM